MELPLYYEDIVKIIPHRYPFLLIDRVTEVELGKSIAGYKNVTANEPFFQGHFPDKPVMPGVLIIEAMAQMGGVMARLSVPESLNNKEKESIYFISMDKVKFRKPVVPGDQIRFELTALRTGSRVWKMVGKALVKKDLVAEAVLAATIG